MSETPTLAGKSLTDISADNDVSEKSIAHDSTITKPAHTSPDKQIVPGATTTPRKRNIDRPQYFRLVLLGVLICLLNMACAWWLIWSSDKFVMTGLISDKTSATGKALDLAATADRDKLAFLNRVVENDVNHRNVANKHTTVIVAMAASFSLVALGFALFVMGVDAAYNISSENPTGRIVIEATSPGLVCFILAALVICFAITRRTEVKFAPMVFDSDLRQTAKLPATNAVPAGNTPGTLPDDIYLKPRDSKKASQP
jgi:hypothetical protein